MEELCPNFDFLVLLEEVVRFDKDELAMLDDRLDLQRLIQVVWC